MECQRVTTRTKAHRHTLPVTLIWEMVLVEIPLGDPKNG